MNNKLAILCGVSLLTNAFIGGFIISNISQHGPHGPHGPQFGHDGPPPRPEMFLSKMIEEHASSLSPESQAKIKLILEKYAPKKENESGPSRLGFNERMEELRATMTAPKLDMAKLKADRKKIDDFETSHHKQIGDMLDAIATTLPDKERIQFFEDFFAPRMP